MLPFRNLQRGFTLIEMLVVIAIISILIGIGINTFTIAQQKARDVRRKADLRSIQTALELYKQDKGDYPTGVAPYGLGPIADEPTKSEIAPYLPTIPQDPKNTGSNWDAGASGGPMYVYYYYKTGVGSSQLLAAFENIHDAECCKNKAYGQIHGNIVCPNAGGYANYYMVTSQ